MNNDKNKQSKRHLEGLIMKVTSTLLLIWTSVLLTVFGQNSYYEQISLAGTKQEGEYERLSSSVAGNRTNTKSTTKTVAVHDKMMRDTTKQAQPPENKERAKTPFGETIRKTIRFPRCYRAQGQISLPFDGIIEPFEAWYCAKFNMSRIDYYYGKLSTRSDCRSKTGGCVHVYSDIVHTNAFSKGSVLSDRKRNDCSASTLAFLKCSDCPH